MRRIQPLADQHRSLSRAMLLTPATAPTA